MEIGMDDPRTIDNLLVARMVRLNATVHGIVLGLVGGLGLFVATLWLVLKGGPVVGPHLALLGQFFVGYRVTLLGSFVGLAYGFAVGFLVGFVVTTLYNWLGGPRDGAPVGFQQGLLIVLVGIGVLLLVIEVVALGNGLALARTITSSVDELFDGTERVKSGDLVRLPMGPVPVTLVNALAKRRDELRDVRVWQGATRHPHAWSLGDASWNEHVQFVSDFLSPGLRPGMAARATDFAITDYAIADRVRAEGRQNNFDADVFMALVSEPDADGCVTFGYSIWHSKALLRHARLSIAEVGKNIVRPCGDTRVPLSEFDLVVEQREEPNKIVIPELTPERIEVTEVVGAYVSTLINDGDTVQIGTGTLSSTMGGYLMEKNDLGIDAEILVATVVDMIKAGVATGKHKTYKPGLATGSFIVPGSDFEYCDLNPKIELYKPYPNSNCLHCHDDARRFVEGAAHRPILPALQAGTTSCLSCHRIAHDMAKVDADELWQAH